MGLRRLIPSNHHPVFNWDEVRQLNPQFVASLQIQSSV